MADKKKTDAGSQEKTQELERINKQLDMLDQRLDNLDSMVTAVAERVMIRPVALNLTCPNCGKNIEIALIGSERPTK